MNDPRLINRTLGTFQTATHANLIEPAVRKRILIVDDEVTNTRLLKMNLERTREFEVRTENVSTHALATAEEFQPDLILLDVMMPGMDGGVLSAKLQASPRLANVPIVFLTAAVTKSEVRDRGGQIGGLAFLAKPVNLDEVLRCIHQHLEPHL